MKYYEGELTQDQIDAGLAVMGREFDALKVMGALRKAGVEKIVPASKRLIARELKAGNIARVTQGIYRKV